MSSSDSTTLVHEERLELAQLLADLTPEQWNAPTLCSRWRVRDVVAHIISYDTLRSVGMAGVFARAGLRPDRANDLALTPLASLDSQELLAAFHAHLRPAGLTAGFRGRIGLVDGLIHHQDIRRALGRPRAVAPERLAAALPFALFMPPIGAFWRACGLRLAATDLDWSTGRGPLVEGPGEAVLMAIAGRPAALDELTGPGRPRLARRM